MQKKLYVFKDSNGGEIIESFQPYTEYLEIDKELRELNELEKEFSKEITVKAKVIEKKQTKLSYKDQRAYDMLPKEIEELEEKKLKR